MRQKSKSVTNGASLGFEHNLRGNDAVHLACALDLAGDPGGACYTGIARHPIDRVCQGSSDGLSTYLNRIRAAYAPTQN